MLQKFSIKIEALKNYILYILHLDVLSKLKNYVMTINVTEFAKRDLIHAFNFPM